MGKSTSNHGQILVFEPVRLIRYLLRRNFEKRGWAVIEAVTSAQAAALLELHTPALIVMDHQADFDWLFLTALCSEAVVIPMIFTPNIVLRDVFPPDELTLGLRAVFIKPYELTELIRVCASLLEAGKR